MNKDDYIIEDTFNPQSRFEHLEPVSYTHLTLPTKLEV